MEGEDGDSVRKPICLKTFWFRFSTDPYLSDFDVPVVRVNVYRLACEFPVDEILRVQVVHTLQDLPCPLFDHS